MSPDLDGRQLISITGSSNLKAHRKYNAIIAAKNDFGDSNSTGEIPFSKPVCNLHTGCTHLIAREPWYSNHVLKSVQVA